MYSFCLALHTALEQMPKRERYSLGQRCDTYSLELLELFYIANSKKSTYRIATLKQADLKLRILRVLLRLAYDLQALDQKKYLGLQERLQELGKMLGGWIKSTALEQ